MYHDFLGREIEDAEMDGMHEEARESAKDTAPLVQAGSTVYIDGVAWTVRSCWDDPLNRGNAYAVYDLIRQDGEQTLYTLRQHGELDVCPFCAFFEQPVRPVGAGKVGDIAACDVCSSGPDISEMLLDWYEEYIHA